MRLFLVEHNHNAWYVFAPDMGAAIQTWQKQTGHGGFPTEIVQSGVKLLLPEPAPDLAAAEKAGQA